MTQDRAPLNISAQVGCNVVYETSVDGAFATIYGEARLVHFEVWAYQVNPGEVSVGDPVDLSKQIDGTPNVRLS